MQISVQELLLFQHRYCFMYICTYSVIRIYVFMILYIFPPFWQLKYFIFQGLPGFKAGLTKFSSLVASAALSYQGGHGFWDLYNAIQDDSNCQVFMMIW